ncbi:MAG: cytochrome-c peroxidase [Saprospiraceae bacterium]
MNRIPIFLLLALGFGACKKDQPTEPQTPIEFRKPAHFPEPVYDLPARNPVNPEVFALGRRLFFDPILSLDGSISCGDCHQQAAAFAHPEHPLSHGIHDQFGTRNSPALFNLAWQPHFFWDGGVHDLDLFAISPIENPVEMGEKLPNVLEKLRRHAEYPAVFAKAYGDTAVTTERFLKSLSQFMLLMVSDNSPYDRHLTGDAAALTDTEKAGLEIFRAKCASCHTEPLLTDFSFRNNGFPSGIDFGRELITLNPDDKYKFKVPSLRNVAKSAPYMHNGRIATLEAVLDHYAKNVKDGPTLDPLLRQNGSLGIPLTDDEKTKLLAFLNALTDEEFLNDERFR